MTHLLREGEESIFSELKSQGYYVWMNDRNDLVAAQEEEALSRHASEIFYGGNIRPPKVSDRTGKGKSIPETTRM